jgi:hypothetical protein
MHLAAMIVEVGEGHPAIAQILRESKRFGYKKSTVLYLKGLVTKRSGNLKRQTRRLVVVM